MILIVRCAGMVIARGVLDAIRPARTARTVIIGTSALIRSLASRIWHTFGPALWRVRRTLRRHGVKAKKLAVSMGAVEIGMGELADILARKKGKVRSG